MNPVHSLSQDRTNIRKLKPKKVEKLAVSTQEGIHVISVRSIVFCEAWSSYSRISTNDGRCIVIARPLKSLVKTLPLADFKRCHQSYLINIHEVIRVGQKLEMSNGVVLPIARSKKCLVKGWLQDIADFV